MGVRPYFKPEQLGDCCRVKQNGRPDVAPRYVTHAFVIDAVTGEIYCVGEAYCSPRDVASRKLGRLIAHNRAVARFERMTGI